MQIKRIITIIIIVGLLPTIVWGKTIIRSSTGKSKIITPNSITNGLVLWLTFDGNNFQQNAVDSSGTGNTGYLIKPSTTATSSAVRAGKLGQTFNGSTATGANAIYVSVNRNSTLNLSTAVTTCAWVYPRSGTNNGIIHKGTLSSGQPDYGFIRNSATQVLWRLNGAAADVASTAGSVPVNAWTYVCGTYDKTTSIVYINGVFNNSTPFSTNITDTASSQVYVGTYFTTSFPFNGLVDDVRIYNRALSASEILQLYNSGRFIIKPSL